MHDPKPAAAPVVGVDIGGTNMQIGVVDGTDALVGRARARTEADRGVKHVVEVVADGIDRACDDAGLRTTDVRAAGVAVAGAIDVSRGAVLASPNLGWVDVPLRDLLAARLGVPVVVDNDVNGAVWAEHRLGAGRGHDDLLGVWVGTGIGGGLVLGGRLHHGPLFTAGEIGHTRITADGPPGRRTVEDHCGRRGMRAIIAEELPGHPESIIPSLVNGDLAGLDTPELHRAYESGDELAVRVVDRGADLLGVAIANWITVLALDTVVVGGGITETFGEPYLRRVRAGFESAVFPEHCRACAVLMTALAADAGLLGAALLARDRGTGLACD